MEIGTSILIFLVKIKKNLQCFVINIGGEFITTPELLKRGHGCKKCAIEINSKKQIKSFEENVLDFHKTFNGCSPYLYEEETGKDNEYFNVTCKLHGKFSITPSNHKQGHGCPDCYKENKTGNFRISDWIQNAKESSSFDSFKVYILFCFDVETKECFIKIGKTFKKVSDRFRSKSYLPYQYILLKEYIFDDGLVCSQFESELLLKFNKFKYLPLKEFGGKYECFKFYK